jgi:hypothetical protein
MEVELINDGREKKKLNGKLKKKVILLNAGWLTHTCSYLLKDMRYARTSPNPIVEFTHSKKCA